MRTTIILLAAAFVLVGVPFAAADESDPDCEADQPWIGYRTTGPVRSVYYTNAPAPLNTVNTCEGEHWDGQDSVQPDQSTTCTPSANPDPADFFVGSCLNADPNTALGEDPTNPLGFRVSTDGSQVYTAANIALVGRAAVYVGQDSAGVYLRDNTPSNVLATVVSSARVTQGYVDETDCSQATYQEGAMTGTPLCGRDNTAITVEHGLLA